MSILCKGLVKTCWIKFKNTILHLWKHFKMQGCFDKSEPCWYIITCLFYFIVKNQQSSSCVVTFDKSIDMEVILNIILQMTTDNNFC